MSQAQDAHDVASFVVQIQGEMASATLADDELSQFAALASSDPRVSVQRGERIEYARQPGFSRFRRDLEQKLPKPLDIFEGASRKNYLRHGLSRGRAARLPRASASKYARASSSTTPLPVACISFSAMSASSINRR